MKEIPLTQGKVALVDDADYEWLMQWKWCADRCREGFRAARKTRIESGQRTVFMHRMLVPDAKIVDHKDGNGLNNQRENLRAATSAQNARNRGRTKHNMSGFKGVVSVRGKSKPWAAKIMVSGDHRYLGRFATPEEAAHAYDTAALQLHGEFAKLNFPPTQ